MAALTIPSTGVLPNADTVVDHGTAGRSIVAGESVTFRTTGGHWAKGEADTAASAGRDGVGVALNDARKGQPIAIATGGSLTFTGATMSVGEQYVLSGVQGGVAPTSDLGASDFVTNIGIATSATVIKLNLWHSGATIPS